MDVLTELFSSRVKAAVLRLLFGSESGELHVRDLARRAGLNDATVRQELKKLLRLKLVKLERDGNRVYASADATHPLYADLRGLVEKTCGVPAVLREALSSTNGEIQLAFVFGSTAAETQKVDSDIDLLVVGSLSLRQLVKRLSGVGQRLGREINPVLYTPDEFAVKTGRHDHFITTVLEGPKQFLIGDERELKAMAR